MGRHYSKMHQAPFSENIIYKNISQDKYNKYVPVYYFVSLLLYYFHIMKITRFLTHNQLNKILDWSKFKAFADEKKCGLKSENCL